MASIHSQAQGSALRGSVRGSRRGRLHCVCARKVSGGKQVVISKTLVALPGHENDVAKLVAGVTKYSLEQAAHRSSGLIVFEAVKDAWESNMFHTWERYESNAAMGRHNTTPQYQAFMEQVQPHLERPVAMVLYTWKDGQLGPPCMSEGPKGEGGLDDATGASGAAGGASMKQTSNSFNLSGDLDPSLEGDVLANTLAHVQEHAMAGLKGLFNNMFGKSDKAGKEKAGRR